MAWAFPVSDVDTNTIVALGNGDGVFVGSGVVIATTGNAPTVDGNDNQHKAIVHGTVVGNLLAITFGVQGASHLGHEVTVGSTGIVEALAANGIALAVSGGNSTVLNEGLIQALDGNAVFMDSVSFFGHGSSFSNAGIIRAGIGHRAILRTASSGETLTFTNSGLVEGGIAYDSPNFLAKDLITNTGRMIGLIALGQGDDVYDGAGGRLSGAVAGQQGEDQLSGGIDNDQFEGGTGDDTLTGNAGNDSLKGDADNDTLNGGLGSDTLDGGLGDDVFFLDNGSDAVVDAGGLDTIHSTISRSLASYVTIDNLTLDGSAAMDGTGNGLSNTITGNSAANKLTGGLGADTLNGGLGNDTYVLETGTDIVVDSGGIDTITSTSTRSLASYAAIENLTLTGNAAINGTGNGLANVITGNAAANILNGGLGNDVLSGGLGNDRLIGGAGDDTLNGGTGIDTLTGGANNDKFVFNAGLAVTNRDVITDFFAPQDSFQLENAIFTKLGAGVHALNPAFFRIGAKALDANDFIVYNKATGALFYDANANAAGGAIHFATLSNKAAISSADFLVI